MNMENISLYIRINRNVGNAQIQKIFLQARLNCCIDICGL